jgi:hypothetical protein
MIVWKAQAESEHISHHDERDRRRLAIEHQRGNEESGDRGPDQPADERLEDLAPSLLQGRV